MLGIHPSVVARRVASGVNAAAWVDLMTTIPAEVLRTTVGGTFSPYWSRGCDMLKDFVENPDVYESLSTKEVGG